MPGECVFYSSEESISFISEENKLLLFLSGKKLAIPVRKNYTNQAIIKFKLYHLNSYIIGFMVNNKKIDCKCVSTLLTYDIK